MGVMTGKASHECERGTQECVRQLRVSLTGGITGRPLVENGIMTRVRMDKWLWAARFFKTRALASRACELGRIESNGQAAKASREVHVGDLLQVKNDSGQFQVEVLVLSEMRGPAVIAQTLYRETDASRELRLKLAEERKTMPRVEALREGKPSKRDRREIDRLRGRA
jgi:ribosome-associated heat shock protein Hsp15